MKDIKKIMASKTVHRLTKYVIALAMDEDPVDAYYAVRLALDVIRERINPYTAERMEKMEKEDKI